MAIQSAFLLGSGIVLIHILQHSTLKVMIAVGASTIFSAISFGLAYRGRLYAASLILAIQFLLIPTYLALVSLGTFDSALMILPAGMLAVSVVVKPRPMAVFAAATLAATCVVGYGTVHGLVGNPAFFPLVQDDPVDVIGILAIVFFSGIVATYVSYVLTNLLQDLATYQASLEDKVERRTRELAKTNTELQSAMQTLDKARAELVRGEKLAGLGSLVAGVAHELNTPIGNTAMAATSLQAHVSVFSKIVEGGTVRKSDLRRVIEQLHEGTDLIVRSTHRARDLVASFKQVAVDQTSDRRREFLVQELVDDVLRSLRPSFSSKGWVVSSDVQGGIRCNSYPGPLGQIITNLVQNACLHGIANRSDGVVSVVCRAADEGHITIAITDNGVGMTPETMNKIYDPFFTTRLGQGGSGLGLTIVHNLATVMLGGRLNVESTPGKGTCFTVTLPCEAPERALT